MTETQLKNTDLTSAHMYLKDGSRKLVAIFGDVLNTPQQMIQFISNSNLSNYMATNNPGYIESIETVCLEGIDIDLK